ncbi:MAG: HEAT repeat domain-containing protein, partial [candidate division KSB1 bacterium]|nr:HEAT repeat domain-containing protein [candidate division KSB1 bacterium]
IYDYVHSDAYDLPRILETAEMATDRDPNHLPELQRRLNDPDPAVRYWAATGCLVLDEAARSAAGSLRERLTDDDGDVAAVAAEALVRWGDPEGLKGLQKLLDHPNGKVRLRVLNAIYELGDAAAVLRPLAAAKTNDPDEFVARMAAYFV